MSHGQHGRSGRHIYVWAVLNRTNKAQKTKSARRDADEKHWGVKNNRVRWVSVHLSARGERIQQTRLVQRDRGRQRSRLVSLQHRACSQEPTAQHGDRATTTTSPGLTQRGKGWMFDLLPRPPDGDGVYPKKPSFSLSHSSVRSSVFRISNTCRKHRSERSFQPFVSSVQNHWKTWWWCEEAEAQRPWTAGRCEPVCFCCLRTSFAAPACSLQETTALATETRAETGRTACSYPLGWRRWSRAGRRRVRRRAGTCNCRWWTFRLLRRQRENR